MAKGRDSIAPVNVVKLYDVTSITSLVGIYDYTEGIYHGDPSLPHDVAQRNQHDYLLDEVGAFEGFRLLEVGCGLGTLLERARERGVRGIGITISEDQHLKCRRKGLDVKLMNYRNIPEDWNGQFDGIIANGSIEHFCQPEDTINGAQDKIYEEMFRIFSRVLDDSSGSQKVATTVIHFNGRPIDPHKFVKSPLFQLFDRKGFHASILHHGYGGYYPVNDQLKRCAQKNFELLNEVDGTEDYRITSEYWRRQYSKALTTNVRFMYELTKHFLKRPIHTIWVTASLVGPKSWTWQFRGDDPPAKLLRQTWKKRQAKIKS